MKGISEKSKGNCEKTGACTVKPLMPPNINIVGGCYSNMFSFRPALTPVHSKRSVWSSDVWHHLLLLWSRDLHSGAVLQCRWIKSLLSPPGWCDLCALKSLWCYFCTDDAKLQSSGRSTSLMLGSLLDDHHWHSVQIERFNKHVNFTVDGHTQHFRSPGQEDTLEIDYEVSSKLGWKWRDKFKI